MKDVNEILNKYKVEYPNYLLHHILNISSSEITVEDIFTWIENMKELGYTGEIHHAENKDGIILNILDDNKEVLYKIDEEFITTSDNTIYKDKAILALLKSLEFYFEKKDFAPVDNNGLLDLFVTTINDIETLVRDHLLDEGDKLYIELLSNSSIIVLLLVQEDGKMYRIIFDQYWCSFVVQESVESDKDVVYTFNSTEDTKTISDAIIALAWNVL